MVISKSNNALSNPEFESKPSSNSVLLTTKGCLAHATFFSGIAGSVLEACCVTSQNLTLELPVAKDACEGHSS